MLKNASVLIIDDEEIMREVLRTLLEHEGCLVSTAETGEEGVALARAQFFDAALVDVMMPGIDGIETMVELMKLDPDLPVVLITAAPSVEKIVVAMQLGAFNFFEKPFDNKKVLAVVRNAVERRRLTAENLALRETLREQTHQFSSIIGQSPRMRKVFALISQTAPSRTTVLIEGESGTGKELVARALHARSKRAEGPFVTVNSGSLPPDLLESNLFGHVKGAFTGAVAPKKGLFELADNGTIFFDEIASIPLETQAKLLRVLQEREFMRLGGVENIRVDVRIVVATNVNLKEMVDKGRFREDLYYRLDVIKVTLPSLRERPEDIHLLAVHFLNKYGIDNDKEELELTAKALDLLEKYDWPGNVRELENTIERAVVLARETTVGPELIPEGIRGARPFEMTQFDLPPEGISFKEVVAGFETQLIEQALVAADGVQKRAAEMLGIKATTLNEMIKRRRIRLRGRSSRSKRGSSEGGRSVMSESSGSATERAV